jgi:hypothetical protein
MREGYIEWRKRKREGKERVFQFGFKNGEMIDDSVVSHFKLRYLIEKRGCMRDLLIGLLKPHYS